MLGNVLVVEVATGIHIRSLRGSLCSQPLRSYFHRENQEAQSVKIKPLFARRESDGQHRPW